MTPLICDVPYPSTDNLNEDLRSGQILSFAYATVKGEITAVLQYCYHAICIKKYSSEISDILKSMAQAEAMHAQILGAAMEKLGVNPIYVQYPKTKMWYETSCVSRATTPTKMLLDDIRLEMDGIAEYKKMLYVLKNEQVEALVQRLLMDEELHLETLKKLLEKYSQ